ncbi:hypothetical protein [Vibrio fluvialis]|uniref:hypothetical protein n=1 Tax=Vibrio fluvialis TaxID=676 RepID=UPI0025748BC0|nr:hypothetical protein [Vibrio fluvialis]BEI23104.1 hypothetical protein KKIDH5335_14360 [Vibrio fluvialis]
MSSSSQQTIIGYHGTDSAVVSAIQQNNFKPSVGHTEWLGHGVYFFVDGISEPISEACEWAKNQAYKNGDYLYQDFSVLEAKVACSKALDTTTISGLKAYNQLRKKIISTHDKLFVYNRNTLCDDRVMWNLIADFMELQVVIHNLYIKDKVQRKKKINSNVPNCTVMCVKSSDYIDSNSIRVVKKGGVCV